MCASCWSDLGWSWVWLIWILGVVGLVGVVFCNVGTVKVFGFGDDVNFGGDGEREDGELAIFRASEDFVGRVTGAFEELVCCLDAEERDGLDLRQVVVGLALFIEPAEFGIGEVADEFCKGIHGFGDRIVDGDDADGAVVGGDFGFHLG